MLIPVMSMAIVGCENQFDIEKDQKFGETAENYEQAYKGIVEDIYDSCMRRARFVSRITERTQSETTSRLTSELESQFEEIQEEAGLDRDIKVARNTMNIRGTREYFENKCVEYAQYENALLKAHKVLAKYTAAFRKLSSDEIIEELDGAGKLAEELVSLPIPGLVGAASLVPLKDVARELATAIQKALEDQFRRRVLKESVEGVNTDIQKYIATLAVITDETYRNLLIREEAKMNRYYAEVVRQELDKTQKERSSNPVQVSVLLVDKQWQEDRKEANYPEKFAAIDSYLKTLKKMANLHQDLYVSVQESQE